MLVIVSGERTVSEKVPEAVAPAASVRVTEMLLVPGLVGVPESNPAVVRFKPAGNPEPVHWNGATPPVSVKLSE